MASTNEIKVTVVPQTGQLADALEILARHAKACADELRAAQLPPTGFLFAGTDEAEPSS